MGLDENDIKALIAILQKGLESSSEIENQPSKPVKKSKKKSNNKFDNMPESKMHKEDLEFDNKVKKPPPSERLRDYKPIKVKCRVCGKEEKQPPQLVDSFERYKCNKCSTGAG